MTAFAVACEHPEEARGPLPYQGRPADEREWECADCGEWNVVERVAEPSVSAPAPDALFKSFEDLYVNAWISADQFRAQIAKIQDSMGKTEQVARDMFASVKDVVLTMADGSKYASGPAILTLGVDPARRESESVVVVRVAPQLGGDAILYALYSAWSKAGPRGRQSVRWAVSPALYVQIAASVSYSYTYMTASPPMTLAGRPLFVSTILDDDEAYLWYVG